MGSFSNSGPVINPNAMSVYNGQLASMMGNYNNILSGYGQAQSNIGQQTANIAGGYDSAERNVMNTLGVTGGGWGVAAPAAADINASFLHTQGQNQQALISAGLGNSSLLAQSNTMANAQAGRAYANLGSQLASTAAGYQSQFGLARQAAMMQGAGMQTSLAQSYLGNLAGYNFAPKVDLYGQQSRSWADGYGGGGAGGVHPSAMGQPFGGAGFGSPYAGNGYGVGSLGYQGAYGGFNPYAGNTGPQYLGGYGEADAANTGYFPGQIQGVDEGSGE